MRVVIAGILGGVVLFLWGAFAHMNPYLPIGYIGLRTIPNEEPLVRELKLACPEPGLYIIPGMDLSKQPTKEQIEEHAKKQKIGPTGILVINPNGGQGMVPQRLSIEFATGVCTAILAAVLLVQTRNGFAGSVLFVAGLGLFAWIVISVPYWNWYEFPLEFTLAEAIDSVVGWLLAGFVIAAIVRPWRVKSVEPAPAA